MRESKKHIVIAGVFLLIVISLIIGYLLLAVYYRNGYSLGTYINGIYCTGKSVEEINDALTEQYPQVQITILVEEDRTEILTLDQSHFQVDFTKELERILAEQSPFLWGRNLFSFGRYQITPEIIYEETFLQEAIAGLSCIKDAEQPPAEVSIKKGANGYELVDTTKNRFSPEMAAELIYEAVLNGQKTIDLQEIGCYYDLAMTQEWERTCQIWEQVQAFQDFRMNYLFGDLTETVDEAVMAELIKVDENGAFIFDEEGSLILNEEAVAAYIDSIADKYDTYGIFREYQTITGETVTVEGGIYGNELDRKAETEYLIQAVGTHDESDRVPEYIHQALYQGSDDIGPDYIEVNLTDQKLYFVLDHEIYLETDIVSGNLSWRLGTPSRICYVQGKYRNRVLRGPGYASYVNYWVPVYKNIGIHDATWRNQFGGEIYKTNGSHGCINVPLDQMSVIFEQLENGIPVIMYYENEDG